MLHYYRVIPHGARDRAALTVDDIVVYMTCMQSRAVVGGYAAVRYRRFGGHDNSALCCLVMVCGGEERGRCLRCGRG
jgi:hypothetical protein